MDHVRRGWEGPLEVNVGMRAVTKRVLTIYCRLGGNQQWRAAAE